LFERLSARVATRFTAVQTRSHRNQAASKVGAGNTDGRSLDWMSSMTLHIESDLFGTESRIILVEPVDSQCT
jgi:hypothetical protein